MSQTGKDSLIGKTIKVEPVKPAKNNVDLEDNFAETVLEAASSSNLRTDVLESFSTMAQNREKEYELIDTMAMDSTIAAGLETYAEETVQTNDKGQIFWIESEDAETAKYVSFLLNKLDADRNAYRWAYMLAKYGDVYVRLVRQSEFENSIIFGKKKSDNKQLNEDVNVIVNDKNDHYADTLETIRNPGEMFELTKFGKTLGYIRAPINIQKDFRNNNDINSFITYKLMTKDVDIYSATEFVHGCLEISQTRAEEEIDIFMNADDYEANIHPETFNVRRGAGVLNDLFKVWRELTLLENSILLSRLTRSSITRLLQMEVGDMPKSQIMQVTNNVRSLLEHKNALDVGNKMSEYVNPGAAENIVILPTKNGKGAVTQQQLGGDYDPKTLTDLDWFNNKLFGGLKIPKAYFSFTDDGAGFNGGTSLAIISAQFGKTIKRIQEILTQMVTDILNLELIDKGYSRMINNFRVKMQSPITQAEIDKKSDLSNSLRNVSDIMGFLNDIDDPIIKTKVLKSLLSDVLGNQNITNALQEYIEELEKQKRDKNSKDKGEETTSDNEFGGFEGSDNFGGGSDFGMEAPSQAQEEPAGGNEEEGTGQMEEEPVDMEAGPQPESTEASSTEEDNSLPSPEYLGVDLTQNPQR